MFYTLNLLMEKERKENDFSEFADVPRIHSSLGQKTKFKLFQDSLEEACTKAQIDHVLSKPDLFKSKNAKTLSRQGIPLIFLKRFLVKMFEISDFNFEAKKSSILKEFDTEDLNDYVPLFGLNEGFDWIQDNVFLNQEGIKALKEILWVLKSDFPTIQHSPTIPVFLAVTLLFLDKAQSYILISKLIKRSNEDSTDNLIRWHFKFTQKDNEMLFSSVEESVKLLSKNKQIDKTLLNHNVSSLFVEKLDFIQIYWLYSLFLTEGIKVLFRLTIAFANRGANSTATFKGEKPFSLWKEVFSFKLNRNNNKFGKIPLEKIQSLSSNVFYLPNLSLKEANLTGKELIEVWKRLPRSHRVFDLKVVFTASVQGYVLSELCSSAGSSNGALLVLHCAEQKVVIFSGDNFSYTKGVFTKPYDFSVFSLGTAVQVWEAPEKEEQILLVEKENIMVGNKEGIVSLSLNSNLSEMRIGDCNLFGLSLGFKTGKVFDAQLIEFA